MNYTNMNYNNINNNNMNYNNNEMNEMDYGYATSGTGCPTCCPTYQNCSNVCQTCNVQEIPHYVNYHTHTINNCVKRHVNIPVYSNSEETRVINEYVEGSPIYQGTTNTTQNQAAPTGFFGPGFGNPFGGFGPLF